MSVDQFLKCLDSGSVSERTLAVRETALKLINGEVDAENRAANEAALTLVLDDPSPNVRCALAEVLSLNASAPEHLVAALATDQPNVAAPLLARSSQVRDIDLIDRISLVDDATQALIANRTHVSEGLAATLADRAGLMACMTLLSNETAKIAPPTFARIADRFGNDATMRGILSSDPRVPAETRHKVLMEASKAFKIAPFIRRVLGVGRAEAVSDQAANNATISLIETTGTEEYPALIEHLRKEGMLTSGFIIRVLACGKIDFFSDILVGLCGQSQKRVCSILVDGNDITVRALFKRCDINASVHNVLLTGLRSWRAIAHGKHNAGPESVAWDMLCSAQSSVAGHQHANDDLAALLKSLYIEMTRNNARVFAREFAKEVAEAERIAAQAAIHLEISEDDILEGLTGSDGELIEPEAFEQLTANINDILLDDKPDFDDEPSDIDLLSASSNEPFQDDADAEEEISFDDMFNFNINIGSKAA